MKALTEKPKKQIVSFSGGKDSTAMLHMMLERGEPIDEVIFFDGGWEWPQMLDHVDIVEKKTGIKITRLKPEHDFTWWMLDYVPKRTQYPPYKGYGWPGATCRWCTREKQNCLNRYLRELKQGFDLVHCIGFAVGEERRLKGEMARSCYRFPLMEWNIDEKEALDYCLRLGYTWGGLYHYFDRVSCFCCPLQSKKEMLLKKRHFPAVWEKIRAMDAELRRPENGRSPGQKWRPGAYFSEIDATIRGKDEQ